MQQISTNLIYYVEAANYFNSAEFYRKSPLALTHTIAQKSAP